MITETEISKLHLAIFLFNLNAMVGTLVMHFIREEMGINNSIMRELAPTDSHCLNTYVTHLLHVLIN